MSRDSQAAHHHTLWLHSAVLRVATYLTAVGGGHMLDKYPFLLHYIEQVQANVTPQPDLGALNAAWQTVYTREVAHLANGAGTPLLRLRDAGINDAHILALMLVGLVEIDARFSTVYQALHPFPDALHLTFGLLDDLMQHNQAAPVATWQIVQALEARGLLIIADAQRPRTARTLHVPAQVWDVCAGEVGMLQQDNMRSIARKDLPTFADLSDLLPQELREQLERLPEILAQGFVNGVLLRGMRGSGQLEAMGALAKTLGRDLLHVRVHDAKAVAETCRVAGSLALLLNALPLIDLDMSANERVDLRGFAGYGGAFALSIGREGAINGQDAARCITLEVPAARYRARHHRWSKALDVRVNGNGQVVDAISRQYHLTLDGIQQTAQLAQAYAALNGRAHLQTDDVQLATRAINQQQFDSLATRIHTQSDWEDLIVTERTRDDLLTLIMRCRHRETVLDQLASGFKGTTRGVRALFSGASGTGKTLAARIIAASLGLDLYRVELSAVVSKYIGETERNLSQLFARAEEQDIILLLDEGDSLLTGRTDVRSSNDRYANMETNYLLQRLENYEGIILVTTNAASRIDSAFQRRMDVFIEFRTPDANARQRLWTLHLPQTHQLRPNYLWDISLRCNLTGGQIRNAALHATVLAVDADEPVCEAFITAGINREYAKMSAPSPLT